MGSETDKPETLTTTIEVGKDLFLRFKALCVLNEKTISGEIEELIRQRVEKLVKKEENREIVK